MDQVLNYVHMLVETVGLVVIIFKGGAYIGKATAAFTTLADGQKEARLLFKEHTDKDDKDFKEVNKNINELAVQIARQEKHY
jgi:hypothetical protein